MKELSQEATKWLVSAARGGGIISLCRAITILEWHEMYEECAHIVEAIEFAETEVRPKGGWRHTEEVEEIVLRYPGGEKSLETLGRGTLSTMAHAIGPITGRLMLQYKIENGGVGATESFYHKNRG